MGIVKQIENCGSVIGEPTADVKIEDCGELGFVDYIPTAGDPEAVEYIKNNYAEETNIKSGSIQIRFNKDGKPEIIGNNDELVIEVGLE